ncbi:MAG: hypothetical protein ABUT39_24480 [Acidobacteriota bacterium]
MKKAIPVVLLALTLAGCAAAPPPEPVGPIDPPAPVPSPSPPVPTGPPPLPQSRLVCQVPVRKIPLSDLGLPEENRARDVALTRDTIWILFEPNVLVGLPRRERPEGSANAVTAVEDESETIYGQPGDVWETLSVSPRDGTVWIASASAGKLWRKPPVGRVRPVRVAQLKEGGFRDVLAVWDGVYVVPTACGSASVWRVDASGKVLGTGLPQNGNCPVVDLETDWSGRSWALQPESGEAWKLVIGGGGGHWVPAGQELASPGPWPERAGPFRGWFFWSTEPVGLGGEEETLLIRRSADGVKPFREDCGAGNRLLRVAGDERGWVALTREWLLLGEHALESTGSAPGSGD